mmetsp:Transcript_11100/g.26802  ORF Transcript_11100/g.26802 Transcript_11100/m.26802 type:complete len:184 (+) Transcript_11100:591-1142(+)
MACCTYSVRWPWPITTDTSRCASCLLAAATVSTACRSSACFCRSDAAFAATCAFHCAAVCGGGGGGDVDAAGAALNDALRAEFGSVDAFKQQFNAETAAVQGSGWGWLVYDTRVRRVAITTRANQDPVGTVPHHVPLLGVDVWEHAYYLQYKNVRPDYLKAIWDVVAWRTVGERYAAALGGAK